MFVTAPDAGTLRDRLVGRGTETRRSLRHGLHVHVRNPKELKIMII